MHTYCCPFCKEKIHREALVCRYCQRDLPGYGNAGKCSGGWIALLTMTAVFATGAAVLLHGFLKERRRWLK